MELGVCVHPLVRGTGHPHDFCWILFFFFFACLKNPLDFWEGCGQLCIPPAHLEQELFPEALGGASEKSILTDKCSRLLLLCFWGAPDQRLHSDQCLMANNQTYPPCTHPIHFQLTYPLGLHHISSKLVQFNYSFCGKTSFFFFFYKSEGMSV